MRSGQWKDHARGKLTMIVDPNTPPMKSEPKEARDLMIAANNGWLPVLDNLSRLSPWVSDALCRLSTGGRFSTRSCQVHPNSA